MDNPIVISDDEDLEQVKVPNHEVLSASEPKKIPKTQRKTSDMTKQYETALEKNFDNAKYKLPLAITGATKGDYVMLSNETQTLQGGTVLQIISGTIYPILECVEIFGDPSWPKLNNMDRNASFKIIKSNNTYSSTIAENEQDLENFLASKKEISKSYLNVKPKLSANDEVKV